MVKSALCITSNSRIEIVESRRHRAEQKSIELNNELGLKTNDKSDFITKCD